MTFIFIHGSFATSMDAWFPWLKKKLEKRGHEVIIPQLPVDKWNDVKNLNPSNYNPTQNLASWFLTFEKFKSKLQRKDLFFIAHSIGPLFILELAEKYNLRIKNAVFVAPFLRINTGNGLIEKANETFYREDFDFNKLRELIPNSVVIYSDDDPYVNESKANEFAEKIGSKIVKFQKLGHMGIESNLLQFPQLLKIILKML